LVVADLVFLDECEPLLLEPNEEPSDEVVSLTTVESVGGVPSVGLLLRSVIVGSSTLSEPLFPLGAAVKPVVLGDEEVTVPLGRGDGLGVGVGVGVGLGVGVGVGVGLGVGVGVGVGLGVGVGVGVGLGVGVGVGLGVGAHFAELYVTGELERLELVPAFWAALLTLRPVA
jgi:hypothetical protein